MDEFNFKKKFGQNFLTDKNLLAAIVRDAQIDKGMSVVEIGMGRGALTQYLCENAKEVFGFEIDLELKDYLEQKFINVKNLKMHFSDILKYNIKSLEDEINNKYMVVANIPYYITTPIIFHFLENSNTDGLCLMIQKEVAQKIVAKPKTTNYGILSVLCQTFCDCKLTRIVSRKMFVPSPKVDSAVIVLKLKTNFEQQYAAFVRTAFSMRRKTLANNLVNYNGNDKVKIESILTKTFGNKNIRAEELDIQDFKTLYDSIRQ